MTRLLEGATGERLERATYHADFDQWYGRSKEFWKLERSQTFAEPGKEMWEAFDNGDWEESLRLMEASRPKLIEGLRQDEARGMTSRRVRIVSLPPTPYLHWELCFLRIWDEIGDPTRVVVDRDVAGLEDQGPLPEINVMDAGVMYEVVYDD